MVWIRIRLPAQYALLQILTFSLFTPGAVDVGKALCNGKSIPGALAQDLVFSKRERASTTSLHPNFIVVDAIHPRRLCVAFVHFNSLLH